MVVVVLCILIIQNLQVTDTNTIDLDYWTEEEMTILYLYYIK